MPKHFPWRFLVYALVILYLWIDIYVVGGPLAKKIERSRTASGPPDMAASVNAHPITERELNAAIRTYCFVHGIDEKSLSPKRRKAIRATVLGQRIDDLVVWMYSRVNPIEIDEAEVEKSIASFKKQFVSETAFEQRLEEQGMSGEHFEQWMRSQTHQRLWLEAKIAKGITVSDEEAQLWFATNPDASRIPEVLRARHIFLPTLDKDPAEVETAVREIHAQLAAGGKFEELARQHSKDPRTRENGGDLNHFTASRMPADFYDAVSALEPNQPSAPFQTALGWHIAELTERIPPREATFEQVKPEIMALLESERRETAVQLLIDDYKSRANIQILKQPKTTTPQ